jgi:hypothetical protein
MQETNQETYVELVSLLKDQLARKDERIAMLEAQIEEANRHLRRLLSEEGAQEIRAGSAPHREKMPALPAPLRLPDLGPPNTAIAQRVMEAARAPVTAPEPEDAWESTARLEKAYLQQGHRALQARAAPRRRRQGALLGIGVLAVGAFAIVSLTLLRTSTGADTQTVEPPVLQPPQPTRPEPMAAVPSPPRRTPPVVSAPEPAERSAASPIAILPAEPNPPVPYDQSPPRAVSPPEPIRPATTGLPPSPSRPHPTASPASPVSKRVAPQERPHSPAASASPLRSPSPAEYRERAADDPGAPPSPSDQEGTDTGREGLSVTNSSSRYGI